MVRVGKWRLYDVCNPGQTMEVHNMYPAAAYHHLHIELTSHVLEELLYDQTTSYDHDPTRS